MTRISKANSGTSYLDPAERALLFCCEEKGQRRQSSACEFNPYSEKVRCLPDSSLTTSSETKAEFSMSFFPKLFGATELGDLHALRYEDFVAVLGTVPGFTGRRIPPQEVSNVGGALPENFENRPALLGAEIA